MTCEPLAYSGPGANLGGLLICAIAFLIVGTVLLLIGRRRGRPVIVALLLLASGAAVSLTAGTSTPVLADDCPPAHNSLTIEQTSIIKNLAPGILPVPITGIVRNNGTDSTDIVAIVVEITEVTTAPGSVAGECDQSDYILLNSVMPVGRALQPGGSTSFEGASVGFNNKSTNQNACKGATLKLLYTANPN